jgi:hypothetical protein
MVYTLKNGIGLESLEKVGKLRIALTVATMQCCNNKCHLGIAKRVSLLSQIDKNRDCFGGVRQITVAIRRRGIYTDPP